METFLLQYGLLALVILAAIEGDATFVIAGVLAHLGLIDFFAVIVIGSISSFIADCIWFWLGYSHSDWILKSRRYRRVGPVVERLAHKFKGCEIVVARFVYGTRIASSLFWGIHKFSFARFVVLDLTSCLVWALVLTSIGFFFGQSAEAFLGEFKQLEVWLLVAMVGVGLVTLAGKLLLDWQAKQSNLES
jgi:membrane protein DedA with SNARE-associated domain